MKHRITLTFIIVFLMLKTEAQMISLPSTLSYDQAINISLENNPENKVGDLNYTISQEQLSESKLKRAPQIYGRYDIQRNLIIPTTLVPLGEFIPGSTSEELTPIKFGTNWYSGAGIFGSVRIFDPSASGEIKEKKALLELSDVDRQIKKIDLITETGKAYINSILALEQLKFAVEDTLSGRIRFDETSLKHEKGLLKLTDLNRSRLDMNIAVSRYSESEKIYSEALKTLLFWMGFSQEAGTNFILSDTLDLLMEKLGTDTENSFKLENSLTYKRNQLQDQINRIRLKNTKSGFLPVVSLNGYYSGDYYQNQLHISDGRYWFGNSSVNLSVRIPLTEGIDRTKKISQYKYQIEADEASFTSELNQKSLEIRKAIDNLDFFRKEILRKKENIALTRGNYETAFALFQSGRILPSDLSEADLSYKKAKVDYLNTVYNYLNALLELKKIRES